jgi:hypothetical protein
MSLCYEFQKWTMISLASVVISMTIGLVTLAYGYEIDVEIEPESETELWKDIFFS